MEHEFAQQVTDTVNSILKNVHTAIPGTILSYDPKSGLASVRPAMKYTTPEGETIDYPDISGVPVVYQRYKGQQAVMAFPVARGDGCLLVIAEQALDYWLYGRMTSTDLRFDLTNAICIPGLFTKGNGIAAEACQDNAIITEICGGTRIKMQPKKIMIQADGTNSYIEMTSSQITIKCEDVVVDGNLTVTKDATILKNETVVEDLLVNGSITSVGDTVAQGKSLANHSHTGDSGGTTSSPL